MTDINQPRILRRNLRFPNGDSLDKIKRALFSRKLNLPIRDLQFRILLGNLILNQTTNTPTITPMKYFSNDAYIDWSDTGPITIRSNYNGPTRIFTHLLSLLKKYPQYFLFTSPDDNKRSKEMLESRQRMATTILLMPKFNLDFGVSTVDLEYEPLVSGVYVDQDIFKELKSKEQFLNNYFDKHQYAMGGIQLPFKVFIHYRDSVKDKWIGGRVYGHPYTNAPKDLRTGFSINGDKDLTKLDFKSFSARCLHYLSGYENTPEDFYRIPSVESGVIDRETAKQCFMFLFGRGPYSETTGKIKSRFKAGLLPKGTSHQKVINELLKLNPALLKIPTSDPTLGQRKCETIESKILSSIIQYCDFRNIPIAPIHDGIFCRTSDANELSQSMVAIAREALRSELGYDHPLKDIHFIVEASLP